MSAVSYMQVYSYWQSIKDTNHLQAWIDGFQLPSFNAVKALQNDEDWEAIQTYNAQARDFGIVQSSSYVLGLTQQMITKRKKRLQLIEKEIFRCLESSIKVVRVHTEYTRTVSIVLVDTSRIFLAGELTLRQLEVEIAAKDALWNLRVTEYGCVVMASLLHGGKWMQRLPQKNTTGKVMGVVSYGVMGAQIGTAIYPGIGTAIGAVIGVIVGIAMEFL